MLFLVPIIVLLLASGVFVRKRQKFLTFLSLTSIAALSAAWLITSINDTTADSINNTAEVINATQPALRRQFVVEPAVYNHETGRVQPLSEYTSAQDGEVLMRSGGTWALKQPVCSKHEFLLTLTNQNESKQINLFYSRGSSEDRLALASGAAKSKIYQCCPHYGVGVNLYYKFHNDNQWFAYPHKVDREHLKLHSNLLNISSADFQPDVNPPTTTGVEAF